MKSLLRQLMDTVTVAESAASSVIYPQRLLDENGAVQLTLNQSPGGSPAGALRIQGRMTDSLGWATIADIELTETDLASSPFSFILVDVDILPQMRVIWVDSGSGFTVAGSTTCDVWLME